MFAVGAMSDRLEHDGEGKSGNSAGDVHPILTGGSPRTSAFARMAGMLRAQHWLVLMLLGLHAALALDMQPGVARGFLLFHFGCFLLWQPVFRGERRLIWGQVLLVIGAAVVLVFVPNLWFMALWIALLLALIGGQVPSDEGQGRRVISLCASTYLLTVLLIWVVPHLLQPAPYANLTLTVVRYAPLMLLLPLVLIRSESAGDRRGDSPVDLLYSALLFFLVVVLVLGAFVIRQESNTNYVMALAQALLVMAALLFALGWLWDPRGGFNGLGQLVSRYFLSMGTPFEQWMQRLADIAQREREPDRFLELAAQEIAHLPWIGGIDWATVHHKGMAGHVAKYSTDCSQGQLRLNVYTRWAATPSLVLHMRLLTRLLADYYEAKVREQEQRNNAYMQAIFETGTRLTHDVKNLLQSLRSLCSAAEMSQAQDAGALLGLVQRQLPQITQRLQTTLDKLTHRRLEKVEWIPAGDWWNAFVQRHSRDAVQFKHGDVPVEEKIPGDLFDSVTENLVQNALAKQQVKPAIVITVELLQNGVRVTDDGDPVPETVRRNLFQGPVKSSRGLGVGLYQAARQAAEMGYSLRLDSTVQDGVRFVLEHIAMPESR